MRNDHRRVEFKKEELVVFISNAVCPSQYMQWNVDSHMSLDRGTLKKKKKNWQNNRVTIMTLK